LRHRAGRLPPTDCHAGKLYKGRRGEKPVVAGAAWDTVSHELKEELNAFCRKYGYDVVYPP
jgi:hypothetical protein